MKKNSILTAICMICFCSFFTPIAYGADKPNVVLILLDDVSSFAVSAYGANEIWSRENYFPRQAYSTPNIDQLANEGVLIESAFTHSICEPTRVALLSGMHNGRNMVQTKAMHHSQITISDAFKQAGYVTGMYGKWKQTRGTTSIPGVRYISEFGWDDYACFDVVNPNQRYINPDMVVNDVRVSYNNRTDNDPRTGRRWYGPDIFNYKALDFIEAHKNEPFFLYYPMVLVHDEHKPTPDTEPRSAFDNCDESNSNDLRQYIPDMLKYMDKLIGKIVSKIDEVGIRDKTMIIVMGDNGCKEIFRFYMTSGPYLEGDKGHTRFSGEQVPLIVSMPGTVQSGVKYKGITDVTDIYPTVFEACSLTVPNAKWIDGKSFYKQLAGTNTNDHQQAIYRWHNGVNDPMTSTKWLVKFAQTPDFKYYGPHDVFPNGRFFDLRTDPWELEGEQKTYVFWENYWHTGLDMNNLTTEQNTAYLMLKDIVESKEYVGVNSMSIQGNAPLGIGGTLQLSYTLNPANTTLSNVIWVSNNTSVATIDKFGIVTGKAAGTAKITAYSWDDARPVADGGNPEYVTTGVKAEVTVTVGGTPPVQEAYPDGVPHTIPGSIESVNFDKGGAGVAYNDVTSGNTGDGPRQDTDVDTEYKITNGNVGWIAADEWLEYTVNVTETATYTVNVRVASPNGAGKYHIEFSESNNTTTQTVPNTGGWATFQTQTISGINLNAGEQVMRVYMDANGLNLGTISLTKEDTPGGDDFTLGNNSNTNANADGWNSNMVINETDTYTNNSGSAQTITINQFSFYALQEGDPVTPFVVRVNSDNNFTVLAVGTTRTNSEYNTGQNTLAFNNGTAKTIIVNNGQKIAIGFLDANADGSGGSVGSVIPYDGTSPDHIWYTGGTSSTQAGSVSEGSAPGTGANTITTLNRNYHFNISFTTGTSTNVPVTGVSVSPTSATLTSAGATRNLSASVAPSNATYKSVSWSSNNTSVASVNSNGVVSAVSNGSAVITVTTSDGGYTASSNITVNIASTENLVQNPGLETGDLTSWAGWGTREVVSDSYSGANAIKVTGAGSLVQVINVQPNTTYTLSAQIKVESGSSVGLGIKEYGGSEMSSTVTSTSYTSASLTFTTGASNTTAKIFFYVAGASQVAYGDNFEVILGTKSADSEEILVSNNSFLNIYPNPVEEFITIEVPSNINNDARISIYNHVGAIMMTKLVDGGKQTLKINDFEAGIYIVNFVNGTESITSKFIKQ